MKKLTIYVTLVALMGLLTVGCTNLDEEVYSQLPMDAYGSTEAEITSLIAPIYTRNRDFNAIHGINNVSDQAVTPTRRGGDWWDGGAFKEMTMGLWRPQTGNAITGTYNTSY